MAQQVGALSGVRILCVDDHQDSLTLLNAILVRNGAVVTQCLSGEVALATLRRDTFDLIISDLSMPPGMDGYDLAHALRKMEDDGMPATPAIALSGDAMRASAKRRFADFQVYVAKPFDRACFIEVAKRLAEADGAAVNAGSLAQYDSEQRAGVAYRDTAVTTHAP